MSPRLAFSTASFRRVGFACRTSSFSVRIASLGATGVLLFLKSLRTCKDNEDQCHGNEDDGQLASRGSAAFVSTTFPPPHGGFLRFAVVFFRVIQVGAARAIGPRRTNRNKASTCPLHPLAQVASLLLGLSASCCFCSDWGCAAGLPPSVLLLAALVLQSSLWLQVLFRFIDARAVVPYEVNRRKAPTRFAFVLFHIIRVGTARAVGPRGANRSKASTSPLHSLAQVASPLLGRSASCCFCWSGGCAAGLSPGVLLLAALGFKSSSWLQVLL